MCPSPDKAANETSTEASSSTDQCFGDHRFGDHCFGRELRVLTTREYRTVFDRNQRRADTYAVLLGHDGDRKHARLGITVSKKVSKKAVVRNRIKRQIREYFRATHHDLQPLDYVVIARSASAGVDTATLHTSLRHHFERFRVCPKRSA